MSATKTITLKEFIQLLTQETYENIVSHHLLFSALTMMVLDSLLTLDQEVDLVWSRRFTPGTYFYVISRYGTMASLFVSCFSDFVKVGKVSCVGYETASIIVSILSTHAFFGQFIARAYAISGNRKLVLLILLLMELARFVNNIATIPTLISICLKNNNLPPAIRRAFNIEGDIQAALNIATQTLCFAITVYHTFGTWRRFRNTTRIKSLSVLVFEQGIYEFGLMAVLVITINILTHTLPGRAQEFANPAPINISLPTILLARFFLALRRRNAPVIREVETKYTSQVSWRQSREKLLAEFGEQAYSLGGRTRTTQVSSSISSGPDGESIPMSTYEPVTVRDNSNYEHFDGPDEELADEAEADVMTPLRPHQV